MTVPGQIEQDHALFAFFFGIQRFINRGTDGMRAFGGGKDAFGAGEKQRCLEGGILRDGDGLDQSRVIKSRKAGSHSVIAQSAGVDGRRDEGMPQREHLTTGAIFAVSP